MFTTEVFLLPSAPVPPKPIPSTVIGRDDDFVEQTSKPLKAALPAEI